MPIQKNARFAVTACFLHAIVVSILFAGCKENTMGEQKRTVTMKSNPLTLVGKEIKVGQPAPDCEVIANDMSAVKLSSYRGKVCIITSVPSLDTSVCDTETRRFNEEAGRLGGGVEGLTISMDLPVAQK